MVIPKKGREAGMCQNPVEENALLMVSAAIASSLAEGRSIEDISVMSALLEVVGDQLALIATLRGSCASKERIGVPPRDDESRTT